MNTNSKTSTPFSNKNLYPYEKLQAGTTPPDSPSTKNPHPNLKCLTDLNTPEKSRQNTSCTSSILTDSSTQSFNEKSSAEHEFTFCHSDAHSCAQKYRSGSNKFLYSSTSVQAALLYALLFNHLHLEAVQQNLPQITRLSLSCYYRLKKYLLAYDELALENHIQELIFPQSFFRLLENDSLDIDLRKQWLKSFISKVNPLIACEIIRSIGVTQKPRDSCLKQRHLNTINSFANSLGIRIQYQEQFKRYKLGVKRAAIRILLIQSGSSGLITLNKISCFEEDYQ